MLHIFSLSALKCSYWLNVWLFDRFGDTPGIKKGIESPSAWKSPWFMNSLLPGQRFDTDMTYEVPYKGISWCMYDTLQLRLVVSWSMQFILLGTHVPDFIQIWGLHSQYLALFWLFSCFFLHSISTLLKYLDWFSNLTDVHCII